MNKNTLFGFIDAEITGYKSAIKTSIEYDNGKMFCVINRILNNSLKTIKTIRNMASGVTEKLITEKSELMNELIEVVKHDCDYECEIDDCNNCNTKTTTIPLIERIGGVKWEKINEGK